jgi:hypothetical protein
MNDSRRTGASADAAKVSAAFACTGVWAAEMWPVAKVASW